MIDSRIVEDFEQISLPCVVVLLVTRRDQCGVRCGESLFLSGRWTSRVSVDVHETRRVGEQVAIVESLN